MPATMSILRVCAPDFRCVCVCARARCEGLIFRLLLQGKRDECYETSLRIQRVELNDARHYYLTVENDKGSDSFYVTLTVKGMRLSSPFLSRHACLFPYINCHHPAFFHYYASTEFFLFILVAHFPSLRIRHGSLCASF